MGGAAGSELWGATDKSAAERLEAALLGNILNKSNERNFFSDIYQNCSSGYSATILLVATKTPLPAASSDFTLAGIGPPFTAAYNPHRCRNGGRL